MSDQDNMRPKDPYLAAASKEFEEAKRAFEQAQQQ